jgi:hypothetical protein
LEVGNYADILQICYWDFLSILESARIRNAKLSGSPVTKKEVPQSNKDMITRLKEMKKNGK